MSTSETTSAPESESPFGRTCECDCQRWAHEVPKVCQPTTPRAKLVRMYFDDADDPRGVYPRNVCTPCADHITFARSRGGERLATQPNE